VELSPGGRKDVSYRAKIMTISPGILELWKQHSSVTPPKDYDHKKLNGIDLSLLDAEIAGCIHMHVNQGTLEFRHLEMLSNRLIDLNTIVLLLNSEEMAYFNRLRTLADLVLQEVKR
jgi:hypothetical protein